MFSFEKLEIYQEAKELLKEGYELIKGLPESEKWELGSQGRRALTSIVLNIAEGSGRTVKDSINFLRMARGSIFEVVAILQICLELGYITQDQYNAFYAKTERLAKRLNSFINSKKGKD